MKQCLCTPSRLLLMYDLCLVCLSLLGETVGATWLIFGRGGGRPWMLGTLRSSRVRKRGKMGFNQSLINVHPFPPFSTNVFYLPVFNSVAKKKKKSVLR